MADKDIALMAHLMRRAGFGAQYDELTARAAKGYEVMVEELLHPDDHPNGLELDLAERYLHRMESFHQSCTGILYVENDQLQSPVGREDGPLLARRLVYRRQQDSELRHVLRGIGDVPPLWDGQLQDLLVEISRDPAMVFFLDNCLSHKGAINENYGRELLELFSMGVGMDGQFNYTEDDVKECSRAFTGWTIANAIPGQPYGRYEAQFVYNPYDHDDGVKTFLGETGRFNGEDIIDIIVKQPATARFLSRHLYNYFVADEPQVPFWMDTPPQDPETIKMLEDEYFRSGYNIRSMLRVLFNSDAFKNARFSKIKGPVETVVGTLRLVGDWTDPKPGFEWIFDEMKYMGQEPFNPPSVEGWHTGQEWIDGGTLVHRINFIAEYVVMQTTLAYRR